MTFPHWKGSVRILLGPEVTYAIMTIEGFSDLPLEDSPPHNSIEAT